MRNNTPQTMKKWSTREKLEKHLQEIKDVRVCKVVEFKIKKLDTELQEYKNPVVEFAL